MTNAWLHRPLASAVRWTLFTLADTPKNADYLRGLWLFLRSVPWIVAERRPMTAELDVTLRLLDARRFASRRPLLTMHGWRPPRNGRAGVRRASTA